MNKILVFACCSFILSTSCSGGYQLDGEHFDDNSFSESISLNHEVCPVEIYGTPTQIVCADSLLFMINSDITPMVDIFSTEDYKLQKSVIHKGRGRNELLMCRDFILDYPLVWAFDMQQASLLSFNYDEFVDSEVKADYVDKITLEQNSFTNIVKWRDDRFIGSNFLRDEAITILKSDGQIDSTTYNNVPFSFKPSQELSNIKRSYFYLRNFAFSKEQDMLLVYYNNKHIFELYDRNLKLHKRMIGPMRSELKSDIAEEYFTYNSAYLTSDKIYLLYQGDPMGGNSDAANSIIYTFDYNGTPLSRYSLDAAIHSISIDEKERAIYALSSEDRDVLLLKYRY